MFMLRQTSDKMAVLLHKQASVRFHSLLTVLTYKKVSAARIYSRFKSARDPKGHGVTLSAFLSPLSHMEQLLLVTSCDSPAGIGASLRTDKRTDGQTDVMLEIVF